MRGSSSRRWERSCLSSTYWSNPPPGHDPVGRFPVDGDRGQHLVQPQDESRGAVGTAGDLDTPFQPVEPVQPVRSARPIRSPSSVANSPPVDQPVAGLRSPSTVTVAKFSAPGWRRCPKHLGGAVVGPVVDAEGHSPGPPNRPSALPPVWGRRRRLPFARCTKSRSKTGRYFRFPLGAKDFDPGGWAPYLTDGAPSACFRAFASHDFIAHAIMTASLALIRSRSPAKQGSAAADDPHAADMF